MKVTIKAMMILLATDMWPPVQTITTNNYSLNPYGKSRSNCLTTFGIIPSCASAS